MSTRDTILQAVRSWFKTALTLTDAQIIPADDKGPRPPLPYLTVRVSVADDPAAVDEVRHADNAGAVQWRTKGLRRAIVDVQGHDTVGTTTTAGWLEDAALRLTRSDVVAVIDAAGLSVVNRGRVVDVTIPMDTQMERRHLRTFELGYAVSDSSSTAPTELETVELDLTLERYENHPDPLLVDVDVDLTP